MVATVLYCSESSGRVLTYFDRVGTVGMERDSSWSFVPFQAVCVHFEFQATEQPTRTKNNPTDFCGGIAQLDPKTGVPSRGQRVLLARTMTFHANVAQGKPQSRRCYSHPSGTLGKISSYAIAVAVRRWLLKFHDDFSSTTLPEINRQVSFAAPSFSLVRLLVRPWPYRVAPAAGESCGAHICPIPC